MKLARWGRMNRVLGLRWSLFLALGIMPMACSGSSSGDDDGGGGQAGSGPGGTPSDAAGQGGDSGSTAGGTGGSSQPMPSCTPVGDAKNGFIACQEGYSHRARAVAC